jgi:hypothetical protein
MRGKRTKVDRKRGKILLSGEHTPRFHKQRKGGKDMKKLGIFCLALIFATVAVGWGWAQEKAKKEEPAAVKPAAEKPTEAAKAPQEKAKMEEKKEAPKPMTWRAGGVVQAVDARDKVLTIHQVTIHHDRTLKLKVSGGAAKDLSALKTGDLVNVWITDQVVTALNKLG